MVSRPPLYSQKQLRPVSLEELLPFSCLNTSTSDPRSYTAFIALRKGQVRTSKPGGEVGDLSSTKSAYEIEYETLCSLLTILLANESMQHPITFNTLSLSPVIRGSLPLRHDAHELRFKNGFAFLDHLMNGWQRYHSRDIFHPQYVTARTPLTGYLGLRRPMVQEVHQEIQRVHRQQ
jgi:hypothetical protein